MSFFFHLKSRNGRCQHMPHRQERREKVEDRSVRSSGGEAAQQGTRSETLGNAEGGEADRSARGAGTSLRHGVGKKAKGVRPHCVDDLGEEEEAVEEE